MNMFFISRSPVASSWIGWELAFLIRIRATSRDGHIPRGAICVVAGTRGSFPTKQFKAARKSGRIRRHFRFNLPNGVSSYTERPAFDRCWIYFSASEILRSPRSSVGLKDLSDLKSMTRIWRKQNGELAKLVALDVEAESYLASIDSTAFATSSALTAFMQRKSIGHSRRKHGLHSTWCRKTICPLPRGPVRRGSVEPKTATTGTPTNAARCIVPVSLVSSRLHRRNSSMSCSSVV